MKTKKYLEVKRIDKENGFTCGYVIGTNESNQMHSHNYYEIILIKSGTVCHIINSKKQWLSEGDLVFLRDFDVHDFLHGDEVVFEYIYVSISKKFFMSIVEHLGNDFPLKSFLEAPPYPPTVSLTPNEAENVTNIIANLDQINNKPSARLKVKTLLSNIFVNYLIDYDSKQSNIPSWLEDTCNQMKKDLNFIEGTKKMLEISGKTKEHLSRTFKRYYNTSPNQFLNDLRLEYCVDQMNKTDKSIVDICFESGFESLSWFYKLFKKKFNTTPAKYRENLKS